MTARCARDHRSPSIVVGVRAVLVAASVGTMGVIGLFRDTFVVPPVPGPATLLSRTRRRGVLPDGGVA